MKVGIVRIGNPDEALLAPVRTSIVKELGASLARHEPTIDPALARHPERDQHGDCRPGNVRVDAREDSGPIEPDGDPRSRRGNCDEPVDAALPVDDIALPGASR